MIGMIWVRVKKKDIDYLTKMNYDDWCDRLVIEGKKSDVSGLNPVKTTGSKVWKMLWIFLSVTQLVSKFALLLLQV